MTCSLVSVVIALCPLANCYDFFTAEPNAIPYYTQRPDLGDYDSKPVLAAMC